MYVSALTEADFRFTRPSLLHFLPFIASLAYLLPFFLQSAAAKIAFVEAEVSPNLPSRAEEWIIWLYVQGSLWAYSILSLRKYRQYRQRLEDTVSSLHRYAWNWLLAFLVSVLAMLRLDYISSAQEEKAKPGLAREREGPEWGAVFEDVAAAARRGSLFRSAELTLPELAEKLGYSRTELSRIINLGGNMNFYDFINKLRVEDVRNRLENEAESKASILEVAFDSGFNTKSTFHASFKKWTGLTPSLYRKQAAAGQRT